MKYTHDDLMAYNDANETIRKSTAEMRNPRVAENVNRRAMHTRKIADATAIKKNYHEMYGAPPSHHYNDDDYRSDDDRYNATMDMMADVISRILPHLDDMDVENRRGVPGTGPYSRRRRGYGRGRGRGRVRVGGYTRRLPRADADDYNDMDDDRYDDWNDDDHNDMENARRRRRLPPRDRYGQFRPRSDMDDRYSDDRMDDMARAAATAAADTARRMTDDRTRGDYSPVMPRHDDRRTSDDRNDTTGIGPTRR